jgi:SH3-like domain-containing protein
LNSDRRSQPEFFLQKHGIIAALLLALVSCGIAGCNRKRTPDSPVIGHAFAGPANLNLHADIDSKSAAVVTVHHGDPLDIVAKRRSWYKVRTEKGVEGWTSNAQLLDSGQMKRLKALSTETAGMPSQGVATTFSTLNVHSEPSRAATSFLQIKEHEKVDVIAHKVLPRLLTAPKRELIPPRPKPEKKKSKESESKVPLPPPPPAPDPPADWMELSQAGGDPAPEPVEAPKVPMDDWTLIRTETGQSGWVLTSAIYLAIPDEVAQYAEGHRITSYFSLGKIDDGDQKKDIWLWTTSEKLGEDHDFDGYRVFVWATRRHRYETAYIQRRIRGFFPVVAKQGEFSVCLEQEDGTRTRKQYAMMGNAVRGAGQRPCDQKTDQSGASDETVQNGNAMKNEQQDLADRIKKKVKGVFGK